MLSIHFFTDAICISRVGGRSVKENIIHIYRTVFSNEVVKQSSWKGLRNNFKISNLKTMIRGIQGKNISYNM